MFAAASTQHDERLIRTANRIMDSLDRWDDRLSGHYSTLRSHDRQHFRTTVSILIPHENPEEAVAFQAFARDISRSGLSFVHPEEIRFSEAVVCLDKDAENPIWLKAKVVRARMVQDGWWEYGLCFSGKATM